MDASHPFCVASGIRRKAKQNHNAIRRNLSAFAITETELNVIAALAMIGLRRIPKNGYKTPAAMGTPKTL